MRGAVLTVQVTLMRGARWRGWGFGVYVYISIVLSVNPPPPAPRPDPPQTPPQALIK